MYLVCWNPSERNKTNVIVKSLCHGFIFLQEIGIHILRISDGFSHTHMSVSSKLVIIKVWIIIHSTTLLEYHPNVLMMRKYMILYKYDLRYLRISPNLAAYSEIQQKLSWWIRNHWSVSWTYSDWIYSAA